MGFFPLHLKALLPAVLRIFITKITHIGNFELGVALMV